MGFDLSYSLERPTPLSAEELDVLAKHLRRWRGKIINYDWKVPGTPDAEHPEVLAWGQLRPTHGKPDVSDRGGYLAHVIDKVHEAMAEVRDLIPGARLAFADDFGAFAWTAHGFDYRKDAPYPPWPSDAAAWVSLATVRDIPTGREAKEAAKVSARPTTRATALEALASADRNKLIEIVLAPIQAKVRDLDRTAAVELLGRTPDPHVCAVLVERIRTDQFRRKWTPDVLRVLTAGPRRCSWATALLAFDSYWEGAAPLLFATVDDDAIPHLARLPATERWNALVVQALDALDTEAARVAQQERVARVFDTWPAAHLAVVTSILAAQRATDVRAGLQRVATALNRFGEHENWLAHERNAGAKALAVLDGKRVTKGTIDAGLAALADFARRHDRTTMHYAQRRELLELEGAWIQRLRPM